MVVLTADLLCHVVSYYSCGIESGGGASLAFVAANPRCRYATELSTCGDARPTPGCHNEPVSGDGARTRMERTSVIFTVRGAYTRSALEAFGEYMQHPFSEYNSNVMYSVAGVRPATTTTRRPLPKANRQPQQLSARGATEKSSGGGNDAHDADDRQHPSSEDEESDGDDGSYDHSLGWHSSSRLRSDAFVCIARQNEAFHAAARARTMRADTAESKNRMVTVMHQGPRRFRDGTDVEMAALRRRVKTRWIRVVTIRDTQIDEVLLYLTAWWLRRPVTTTPSAPPTAAVGGRRGEQHGSTSGGGRSTTTGSLWEKFHDPAMQTDLVTQRRLPIAVDSCSLVGQASFANITPFLFEDGLLTVLSLSACQGLKELVFHSPQQQQQSPGQGTRANREGGGTTATAREDAAVERCLAFQNVRMINLSSCANLTFPPLLSLARRLRRIDLSGTCIFELTCLADCTALEEVICCFCKNLVSCEGLGGLPRLVKFKATSSRVMDITALGSCPRLQIVELNECSWIHSVSALAGCSELRVLDVSSTPVGPLCALSACRKLEHLHSAYCEHIFDDYPCVPAMFYVCMTSTKVQDLTCLVDPGFSSQQRRQQESGEDADGVGTPTLADAVDNSNDHSRERDHREAMQKLVQEQLKSQQQMLEDLGADPAITQYQRVAAARVALQRAGKHVEAGFTASLPATAVSRAAAALARPVLDLTILDLNNCRDVTSLAPLQVCKSLSVLKAAYTSILTLDGLDGCQALTSVQVNNCAALRNITALAAVKTLRAIDVSMCKELMSLDGLECSARAAGEKQFTVTGDAKGHHQNTPRHRHARETNAQSTRSPNRDGELNEVMREFGHTELGLVSVIAAHCAGLADISALQKATRLEVLNITNCREVSALPGGLHSLLHLNITNCRKLRTTVLVPPELLAARLEYLRHPERDKVDSQAFPESHPSAATAAAAAAAAGGPFPFPIPHGDVASLTQGSPNLCYIEGARSGVTDVAFLAWIPRLKVANMSGCSGSNGKPPVDNAEVLKLFVFRA